MKSPIWRCFAALPMLALVACGDPPAPDQTVTARPVKTILIGDIGNDAVRRFPARIDAGRKAQLAFRVPGTLTDLAVNEGDRVDEGQVVATLDPKDFQLVVNDRSTTFENARKNYERGKELVGRGAISQMDFDRLEAEFRNARTALEAARQDLSYTRLATPFAGTIARRYVENFEEVQAKQVVMDLQDTAELTVAFDVPERLIRSLRRGECGGPGAEKQADVQVSFDDLPGTSYPLVFREVATRADDATQTFEVTYTMPRSDRVTILPGMSANAAVDLSNCVADAPSSTRVPLAAVTGDTSLDSRVWVVDEGSMTVSARSVEVGDLQGTSVEIRTGLQAGERIVVAGADFLADGMPVTLLPQTEQADPRPGE